MAAISHNPFFKVPTGPPPRRYRSPSPPLAHVEPLSPSKPKALEPQFNYPALDPTVHFSVHAEQAFAATPRPRASSVNHKSGHKRTPSTIDTLAEAALVVSPSYHAHSRQSSGSRQYPPPHAQPQHGIVGTSEPPHKRARSEILPSPQVGAYGSRPATSYETSNGWSHHGAQHAGNAYDSRVEEAALLLNFRTGGMSPPNPPPPSVYRPHANSFPQDAYHTRPADFAMLPALLPPFNPQGGQKPWAALPSPQQTIEDADPGMKAPNESRPMEDVVMNDAPASIMERSEEKPKEPQQTQTPPDEIYARADCAEATPSESAEGGKARRGWPKGKPRSSGARKTIAEKASTKRTAARKKTPDVSKKVGKAKDGQQTEARVRRKSLSDVPADDLASRTLAPDLARSQSVPRDVPTFTREPSPTKMPKRQAKFTSETVCAGCSTTREAAQANSELDEWISCNGCKKWFHIDCAGFKKAHEVRDVDKFFCVVCEPDHGKTTYVRKSARAHASVDYAELQRGVLKTSDESFEHHYIQPIKDGTFQFDPESFPRMRPEMVTREFFEKSNTFVEPICIPAEWNPRPWTERAGKGSGFANAANAGLEPDTALADFLPHDFEYETVQDDGQDRLDMVMPEGLTVRQVCGLVGADTPLDVIDVKTQNSGAKWNLSRWADYYEEEGGDKAIRNVISLEVSQSKLGRLLRRPKIVRDIDLQDAVWPQEETDKGKWPKVQFYCLMSVADSYTDFHIDFGGSSVYYHILRGKKTFFFIPPKAKNLKAYEDWNNDPQQNFTFLPHTTKECFRVDLSEGDTMLIPSGWIHAVWTPEDSLVIGGNFLTRMSYKNQFRVVDIEKANHTPMKFRYPYFQKIMWYTAIQYLKTDPLPQAVSQLFYDGKQFERQIPIWQDFDGDVAANDARLGAPNTRYYPQAELDGLPELVSFIYRTVMLVMGRIEGTSADQQKRVNASIPKGHGEPLEVAKTFALWVAWKRGNEDPPAWAHPDAELQLQKDEGPSKKLSARALKVLERKEAIAAWRIAPDRQSVRVMSKQAAAAATVAKSDASTPVHAPPPPSQHSGQSQPPQSHQSPAFDYQNAPPVASPAALMMNVMHSQHLSTPKTSVLGPKRVACDACRKRRIRCKHKDMVMQAAPAHLPQFDGSHHDPSLHQHVGSDMHDNITVTPAKSRDYYTANGEHQHVTPNGAPTVNGHHYTNGQGPLPGTNAYVSANIPMTMNGVPIFGEVPKRGRSKACFECRKSKRRCVHDENGNVDPIKAAETPVPRGSNASKKRSFGEDGSPMQAIKKQRLSPPSQSQMQHHSPASPAPTANGHHNQPTFQMEVRPPSRQHVQETQEPQGQTQPPIDPSLFTMYPEPAEQAPFATHPYPYPTNEHAQSYDFQSLEQIANEVLDMNGRHHCDTTDGAMKPNNTNEHVHIYQDNSTAIMPNSVPKPDGSVDSAVSLPNNDLADQSPATALDPAFPADLENGAAHNKTESKGHDHDAVFFHGLPPVQQSIEYDAAVNSESAPSTSETQPTPASASKTDVSGLPLYKPPAPLSQSPEAVKRQPFMANGASAHKRRRESSPATQRPSTAKKARDERASREISVLEDDDERMARLIQQEELGLRQRGK